MIAPSRPIEAPDPILINEDHALIKVERIPIRPSPKATTSKTFVGFFLPDRCECSRSINPAKIPPKMGARTLKNGFAS